MTVDSSIVRLRATGAGVAGAGFLVNDRHLLTCAHVVAYAADVPAGASEQPEVTLQLDFPLLAPDQMLEARVCHWQPGIDVAGLALGGWAPPGAAPVRLVTADDLWGHSFRAFGFPAGYEQGVWASGVLRGRQADGAPSEWRLLKGKGWLQIEDAKETGYLIAPGFSGGPVWDDVLEGVVGMIVAADTSEGVRAAFLIPAGVLANAWPDVVSAHRAAPASAPVAGAGVQSGQSGGVTIGNVSGGISGSIIAGGDVTVGSGPGVQPRPPVAEPSPGRDGLTKLRQVLTGRFSEGELRTLCFDVGVDYDSLPGRGKADKARELVEYFQRRQDLSALVEVGRVQRPDIAWDDVLEVG